MGAALTAADVQKVTDACKTTSRGAAAVAVDITTPLKTCVRVVVGGVAYEVDHQDGDGNARTADDIAGVMKDLCGKQP